MLCGKWLSLYSYPYIAYLEKRNFDFLGSSNIIDYVIGYILYFNTDLFISWCSKEGWYKKEYGYLTPFYIQNVK